MWQQLFPHSSLSHSYTDTHFSIIPLLSLTHSLPLLSHSSLLHSSASVSLSSLLLHSLPHHPSLTSPLLSLSIFSLSFSIFCLSHADFLSSSLFLFLTVQLCTIKGCLTGPYPNSKHKLHSFSQARNVTLTRACSSKLVRVPKWKTTLEIEA